MIATKHPAQTCLALALLSLASLASLASQAPQPAQAETSAPHFNRDVRPILADKCFVCHGPDRGSRKARLRLDDGDAAHETGIFESYEDGTIEFVLRIAAELPEDRMPPPKSNLALSEEERAVLQAWAEAGAKYERHWSFTALPSSVALPELNEKGKSWARNPIDVFVFDGLAQANLSPTKPAAPERWLRRVSYDLTGLPPTPEVLESFLQDTSEAGYERVVSQLTDSPSFGERMATPWLDVARYADSYGYQSDQLSPTWPFRDWVVRAFNDNLPFDQFLTWQLAGDLLPEATSDQRLATAFNRLHRMTNEGGSIEAEWRNEYVSDRVHTLGTAVMGLSLECARCHDHKYDPISQADYYSLQAYFNSIDEFGMYNDSARVPTPSLLLPTAQQSTKSQELEQLAKEAQAKLEQSEAAAKERFEAWLADSDQLQSAPELAQSGKVAHFSFDELDAEHHFVNSLDSENPGTTNSANAVVEGHLNGALLFSGDDVAELPKALGNLQPHRAFTLAMWMKLPADLKDAVVLHQSSGTDVGFHGMELSLRENQLRFSFARFWPGNAIAVSGPDVPRDEWVHLAATYDGSFDANGLKLYVNGQRNDRILRNEITKLPSQGGDSLSLGQRFRDWGLRGGALDELQAFERALSPLETIELQQADSLEQALLAGDKESLWPFYLAAVDSEVQSAHRQRNAALHQKFRHQTGFLEVPVMREMQQPRPAHTLARGDYNSPRTDDNLAPRRIPSALRQLSASNSNGASATPVAPKDRLELARWLTAPNHPLTARVAVNRWWQEFFQRGLVASTADFGLQGSSPSHPELLDWLARAFIESGWDLKGLCKEIVLSATYRQDSARSPKLQKQDPGNRLLARGPSGRLSAEMLRDTALLTAGLLDPSRGGPPLSPYQPKGLWRESNSMSPAYKQSVGKALYRRSLYTVWKRTSPIPNMTVFDSPSREVGCSRRQPTNTPLQALVLLNDVQFVEAARVLAERTTLEHPDVEGSSGFAERLTKLFLRLTSAAPTKEQAQLLADLYDQELTSFLAAPEAVGELLAIGEQPLSERFALPPEAPSTDEESSAESVESTNDAAGQAQGTPELPTDQDPTQTPPEVTRARAELAALTIVTQVILNLDATVWKR